MANELCASLAPIDGWAEAGGSPTGGQTQPYSLVPVGTTGIAGAGFPNGVTSSLLFMFRVPNAVALATGLTYNLCVTDDPLNPPSSTGLHSVWDFTIAPLTTASSKPDESPLASSTADKATITHGGTVGQLAFADQAQVVAHTNSLAAGSLALLRLRRLGADSGDTHDGRCVFLNLDVRNT